MNTFVKHILVVSHPRFWLYLAGPYIIGFTISARSIFDYNHLDFWYTLFFFLVPANIFIYALNDFFEEETPRKNQRKQILNEVLIFVSLLFVFPLLFYLRSTPLFCLSLFFLLATGYSAHPIRMKSIPILDFSSNSLFIIPGFIGFFQNQSSIPFEAFPLIIALYSWTSAMHLFCSILDLPVDKKNGRRTTATIMGRKNSLIICTIFWLITVVTVFFYIPFFIILAIYPLLSLLPLFTKNITIQTMYWFFSRINMAMGILIFLYFFLLLR